MPLLLGQEGAGGDSPPLACRAVLSTVTSVKAEALREGWRGQGEVTIKMIGDNMSLKTQTTGYIKRIYHLSCLLFLCIYIAFATGACSSGKFSVTDLKVEYTEIPLGIDVTAPRFSWQMEAPQGERGYTQTAYRIIVKDDKDNPVWDTDKVTEDSSIDITYEGEPLKAATQYHWTVTVWDQTGSTSSASSWFETGLMNPDPNLSAWDNAQWIGGTSDDIVLYSQYLSVFKMQYSVQLDRASSSTRASFIFGANDSRLMDRNKNIYNIESPRDESYIKLELDISKVDGTETGPAQLNIYRAGYHPDDNPYIPFKTLDIPLEIINSGNKYKAHTIYLECVFGTTEIYIDLKDTDHNITKIGGQPHGPFSSDGINLNPVGRGGDYIAFPVLADLGLSVQPGQKARFSKIMVSNYRSPSNTLYQGPSGKISGPREIFADLATDAGSGLTIDKDTYIIDGGTNGAFITVDPSRNSMPMLRTEFSVEDRNIEKARLYVTARGIYEIYMNGKRVGEDRFNPGLTQYNVTHMYQTYDVTDMIKQGEANAMGAFLGEGWWSGNITFTGGNWNYFGDRQSLLAKLVITYGDGRTQVITTNDHEWRYYNNGPVIYGSFFQGEVYDAGKEEAIEGWSTASYDDSSWQNAVEVPLEGTAFSGTSTGLGGTIMDFNYNRLSITGQVGTNVKEIATLIAKDVTEVRPDVFVYDMGQNMVGVPRISITNGKQGKRITMRYAEVLYPDMEEYGDNIGMIMLENIRGAMAQDIYILKGGDEIVQPRFTFHGYRYIEITGIDTALPLDAVQGVVISSVNELASDYKTSNNRVNRLWENIIWSMRGNFLSIPTDCPQRNERMGWSGDISVFSRTATYLADVDRFLARQMLAMRDMQQGNGCFTEVAPIGNGFGGILWCSAGITVAWEIYQQYGDRGLLQEHYASMKGYIEYLETRIDPETGVVNEGPLGDWLSPEGNKNDNTLLWCAYYVYDLDIMSRVAEALGKSNDAAVFLAKYKERKDHFNMTFVDDATHRTKKSGFVSAGFGPFGSPAPESHSVDEIELIDTQASYAVPLALGVFNNENIPYATELLAAACRRQNTDDDGKSRPEYSLMTGFIGTAWISKALSDNGYDDIAYRMLQQNTYPSWLYPVDQGATTIWERLNSYTIEEGFGGNNSMNSFNHYSFGAVGQWMMAYSLGIQRDEPGFKRFILRPEPDPTGEMTWAQGYYDSMYGRIKSAWKVDNDSLTYETSVPANTNALLYLPASSENSAKEGNKNASEAEGIIFIKYEAGKAVYELGPGKYVFSSVLN